MAETMKRGIYTHETPQGASFVAWKRHFLRPGEPEASLAIVIEDDGVAQIGNLVCDGPCKAIFKLFDKAVEWADARGLEAVFWTENPAIMRVASERHGFSPTRVIMSRPSQQEPHGADHEQHQ